MSPFFIVTPFHLRLNKPSELSRYLPSRPIPFAFSYFNDLIIVRQQVHIDPYTLVQDPVADFICLLVPVHFSSRYLSPESLLLSPYYFCAAMGMLRESSGSYCQY